MASPSQVGKVISWLLSYIVQDVHEYGNQVSSELWHCWDDDSPNEQQKTVRPLSSICVPHLTAVLRTCIQYGIAVRSPPTFASGTWCCYRSHVGAMRSLTIVRKHVNTANSLNTTHSHVLSERDTRLQQHLLTQKRSERQDKHGALQNAPRC